VGKKTLAVALAVLLVCTVLPIPAAKAAPGIETAEMWAREGITGALARGFVPAGIQGNYGVDITRGEFVTMAVLWVEYAMDTTIGSILSNRGLSIDRDAFTDTNDYYILSAQALGMVSGSGGIFDPGGVFDRQMAAALIRNICDAFGVDVSAPPATFADMHLAGGWARPGIDFVQANHIMSGSGGNFDPTDTYSRQMGIVTFNNIRIDILRGSQPPIPGTAPQGILTAQQISDKCAPAVFTIYTYSFSGNLGGSGSGFFISPDGLAITNFHVAANSSRMVIYMQDGSIIEDVRTIDYDKDNDLALLRVKGSGFPYLEMADSSTVAQGQTVYAFGSPRGLVNTMSQGIISNVSRVLNGREYIQYTAQATFGSSGGAIVNEQGEVVAVTQGGLPEADLNLAIPINKAKELGMNSTDAYIMWNETYYPGLYPVLDFGSFAGIRPLSVEHTLFGRIYTYDYYDFTDFVCPAAGKVSGLSYSMHYYDLALTALGFKMTEERSTEIGTYFRKYENKDYFIFSTYDNIRQVVTINIMELPYFYSEFPTLPDFGWYTGLDIYMTWIGNLGSTVYCYRYITHYSLWEIQLMLQDYFTLLRLFGFTHQFTNQQSTEFQGYGLSILISIHEYVIFVDVLPMRR
jgi:hypothetical protein